MADVEAAKALAGTIQAKALDALLDWGEAINEAEVSTGALKAVAESKARLCGGRAMELATGLASKLRPTKLRAAAGGG